MYGLTPIIDRKQQGKGLREMASSLNRLNIRPPRGGEWYASSVRSQPVTVQPLKPSLRRAIA
jgi:hypothetical protein